MILFSVYFPRRFGLQIAFFSSRHICKTVSLKKRGFRLAMLLGILSLVSLVSDIAMGNTFYWDVFLIGMLPIVAGVVLLFNRRVFK